MISKNSKFLWKYIGLLSSTSIIVLLPLNVFLIISVFTARVHISIPSLVLYVSVCLTMLLLQVLSSSKRVLYKK